VVYLVPSVYVLACHATAVNKDGVRLWSECSLYMLNGCWCIFAYWWSHEAIAIVCH